MLCPLVLILSVILIVEIITDALQTRIAVDHLMVICAAIMKLGFVLACRASR